MEANFTPTCQIIEKGDFLLNFDLVQNNDAFGFTKTILNLFYPGFSYEILLVFQQVTIYNLVTMDKLMITLSVVLEEFDLNFVIYV